VAPVRPITVAILAMGGEGGGVLADWIVGLAEHSGYLVQATSVPGVAQRTGATIYYVELFPKAAADAAGRDPVFALMPMPGDVDVVIASELMEAGRAVQRGFVTPDRTTFIASTHRVYSMTERVALADGRVDEAALIEGCRAAAKRLLAFDMAALAEATGSVISAVLFGVLAGSGALPFPRTAFEAAIRRGGVGVKTSLDAFVAGYEAAQSPAPVVAAASRQAAERTAPLAPLLDARDAEELMPVTMERDASPASAVLKEAEPFPEPVRAIVRLGLARLADYQDEAYARLYLDRLRPVLELEKRGDGSLRLLEEVARQLALGMAFEDTIRVAELKIRRSRFERVREEVRLGEDQLLDIAEFFHPRVEEIAGTLPERWGRRLLDSRWARRIVERLAKSGKVIRTSSIPGFLTLYAIASLKPLRPRSLRFHAERAFIEGWLSTVRDVAATDYALAVEVAACRNLVKGYGETHERGRERYDLLMSALPRIRQRGDAAAVLATLRQKAQNEESPDLPDMVARASLPQAAE
jgi:indolepyruvate ferredoxin oxidoreductase beta subunit